MDGRIDMARLADRLRDRAKQLGEPLLVAIDGRSGAGKSTFAGELGSVLDACVISGDDFYAGGPAIRSDTPEVLANKCIDRARLLSVLSLLKANREARFAPFDWQVFDGSLASRQTTLQPAPYLVLEGVYAHHPDLRDLVDCAILLRVATPERMRRLRLREGGISAWERQWHRAEDWYFENLATPADFDVVIDADET